MFVLLEQWLFSLIDKLWHPDQRKYGFQSLDASHNMHPHELLSLTKTILFVVAQRICYKKVTQDQSYQHVDEFGKKVQL